MTTFKARDRTGGERGVYTARAERVPGINSRNNVIKSQSKLNRRSDMHRN